MEVNSKSVDELAEWLLEKGFDEQTVDILGGK